MQETGLKKNPRKMQKKRSGSYYDREKLPRQGKKCAVPPSGLLRTAGDRVLKLWMKLCVLHLGFCYKAVFANVVHVAFLFCNLFSADFLLLAGLVVLHRGCPYVSILADEIQVTWFTHDFFLSNFGSHLKHLKTTIGF
jgi:hypothetical protein